MLYLSPLTLKEAIAFVKRHHRHHRPPVGGLFAVGVAQNEEIVGCAIVGRPVARGADNGWTAEVTRLCTLGAQNACSMLYQACWRASRALGYTKLITYTLPEEGGASLRAAGRRCLGEAGGWSWSCKSRPRVDAHPLQVKMKWEQTA